MKKFEWNYSNDERVRNTHKALDGQIVNLLLKDYQERHIDADARHIQYLIILVREE